MFIRLHRPLLCIGVCTHTRESGRILEPKSCPARSVVGSASCDQAAYRSTGECVSYVDAEAAIIASCMCAPRSQELHLKAATEGRAIRWSTERRGGDGRRARGDRDLAEIHPDVDGQRPRWCKSEMVTARSLFVPVLRLLVSQVVSKTAEWTHSGINEAGL